tara:strand:- start:2495 stop:3592 length:1098 start_codon:yes stop_codon:yes gene_type:complete
MKIFEFDHTHSKDIIEKGNRNRIIDKHLHKRLNDTKGLIDNYDKYKWDKYKKHLNPYEYIYIQSNIHKNICKVLPISRSYFKLHEILYDLNLLDNYKKVKITCIAEGPGGFIQSLLNILKTRNIEIEKIYGITLLSEDNDIPSWNPIIESNTNVDILNGIDNTGDICNPNNLLDFIKKIEKNTCDIITCDGGIDYSEDYNNQELSSYEFIYNEIVLSLHLQREGGSLIIKMFDISYYSSIQFIYILYQCYDTVTIIKPYTSRNTNSEKYIVCKGYRYNSRILELLNEYYNKKKNLIIHIPKSFFENIKFYNQIFIENQIKSINDIIDKINQNNIVFNKPTQNQIDKAIEWCKSYDLEINDKCAYL